MTVGFCVQLDKEFIRKQFDRLAADGEGERVILVDGTQFSPSWRALPGGAQVYAMDDDTGTLCERYEFALDEATVDLAGDGFVIYWEDGCLWSRGL